MGLFITVIYLLDPVSILQGRNRARVAHLVIEQVYDNTSLKPIIVKTPYFSEPFLNKICIVKMLSQLHMSGFINPKIMTSILETGCFYFKGFKVSVEKLSDQGDVSNLTSHGNEIYKVI